MLSSVFAVNQKVWKSHRLICMHSLSRAAKVTIANWIMAVATWAEERTPLGLTGNSASFLERHRYFPSVVLHTFVDETILNERNFTQTWNEPCWDWQQALRRKTCLPSPKRHRHFSSALLLHVFVETILCEWRKFCPNFTCRKPTQLLVASLTFDGAAFCFKSFISLLETWTNREAAMLYRVVLSRYEHPIREVVYSNTFPLITWRFPYMFLYCYGE